MTSDPGFQGFLDKLQLDKNQYKVGKTKLFFREGELGGLEARRAKRLTEVIILIQKMVRGFRARQLFKKKKAAVQKIQAWVRMVLARNRYITLRSTVISAQAIRRGTFLILPLPTDLTLPPFLCLPSFASLS